MVQGWSIRGEKLSASARRSTVILSYERLTPELSRPARGEPGGAETAKRARLERIVRHHSRWLKARQRLRPLLPRTKPCGCFSRALACPSYSHLYPRMWR